MRLIPIPVLFAILAAPAAAQDTAQLDGLTWRLSGEVKVAPHRGRQALAFRSGTALLDAPPFENGTVEFDLALRYVRAFTGVSFRREDGGSEQFYLRPHQRGRFDAMQYTPVEHGVAAWQLYPEYNAAFDTPFDRWLHVRLVVSGARLAVYLDGGADPVLVVDRLRRDPRAGGIQLFSSFPAGEPADLFPAAVANVRVTPDRAPGAAAAPEPASSPGVIPSWALSPAVPDPGTPIRRLPTVAGAWTVADADELGRVNIARHRAIPAGAERGTVLARVVIRSDRAQRKKLGLGFSDEGSVFLNGELVFSANNTFLSRSGRYLGIMTVENDALYLPLRAGENELVIAVTEAFGGWGVVGRFEDMDGITVEAAVR